MNWIKLQGMRAARYLASKGRFIFAIKHIEYANPGISREDAKSVVASFHFGDKPERPENLRRPMRAL
ncbi:MAG TPA: hypothetical protein VKG78_02030 [Opitutaceae bacterium]|nr:hypothetical protein [Opitutaceae bacterium]